LNDGSALSEALLACNPEGPLMVNVTKLYVSQVSHAFTFHMHNKLMASCCRTAPSLMC
jgi:hypothetical protein